jgi:hypothetical protein
MIRSNAIRKAARGQECTLQLHPYCNGNPETTVLAHLPGHGRGVGLKATDLAGVFACSSCHDVIDGRCRHDIPEAEVQLAMRRALVRTWSRLAEMGVITVRGAA